MIASMLEMISRSPGEHGSSHLATSTAVSTTMSRPSAGLTNQKSVRLSALDNFEIWHSMQAQVSHILKSSYLIFYFIRPSQSIADSSDMGPGNMTSEHYDALPMTSKH